MSIEPTAPPESPVSAAKAAVERAVFHYRAGGAALDEAVHALAEASLDDLEKQLSNLRERQRPATAWLDVLFRRVGEVAP